jgi:hypothetical protein
MTILFRRARMIDSLGQWLDEARHAFRALRHIQFDAPWLASAPRR